MLMVMILRIYTSDGDNVVLADGGGGDGKWRCHAYSKRDDEDIRRIDCVWGLKYSIWNISFSSYSHTNTHA